MTGNPSNDPNYQPKETPRGQWPESSPQPNNAFGAPQQPYPQPQPYAPAPHYSQPGAFNPGMYKPKSKIIALVLALLFSVLGIHHFYVGNKNIGFTYLLMLVVGIATAIFVIGIILLGVLGVWVLVDMVLIALGVGYFETDDKGVPLTWDI